LAFVLTIPLLTLVDQAAPALASTCTGEATIFWAGINSSGGWQSGATGQQEEIETKTHSLVTCPDDTDEEWATEHFAINGVNNGSWVEMGPKEYVVGNTGYYRLFTEWGISGVTHGYDEWYPVSGCLSPGYYTYYRIRNISTTDDWDMYIACRDGDPWSYITTYNNTGYHTGGVMVETGRVPDSGVGLADSHINLKYRDSSFSWHDWYQLTCRSESASITNWKGNNPSSTSYDTLKQPNTSC